MAGRLARLWIGHKGRAVSYEASLTIECTECSVAECVLLVVTVIVVCEEGT